MSLSPIEFLLCMVIAILLLIYWETRKIRRQVETSFFDPPTNVYGEGLSEGIQNAIVRGQRGISTHEQ